MTTARFVIGRCRSCRRALYAPDPSFVYNNIINLHQCFPIPSFRSPSVSILPIVHFTAFRVFFHPSSAVDDIVTLNETVGAKRITEKRDLAEKFFAISNWRVDLRRRGSRDPFGG